MANDANPYLIPGSVIIAGALIAVGIFFTGGSSGTVSGGNGTGQQAQVGGGGTGDRATIREVDASTDHIRGNPNAPVKIVEYSDFECPFCQRFHGVMGQVLSEYGDDVAWVYRHFPLTSIHPEAAPAARASECVARLSDNDAFWQFADTLFNDQGKLSSDLYVEVATGLGISKESFAECLESSDVADAVSEDANDALGAGARGTPFSVVVSEKNGTLVPVSGALPFEQVKQFIDQAL